jgi:hypothetical protein
MDRAELLDAVPCEQYTRTPRRYRIVDDRMGFSVYLISASATFAADVFRKVRLNDDVIRNYARQEVKVLSAW